MLAPGGRVSASLDCREFVWQVGEVSWVSMALSGLANLNNFSWLSVQSVSLLVWYLSLGSLVIVHSGPGSENLIRRVVGVWTAQKRRAGWPNLKAGSR